MKHIILLLIGSVCLFSACQNADEAYSKAYDAAFHVPLKKERMGFDFKPDMTRAEAEDHLQKLQREDELYLNMPALGKHTIEESSLGYYRDTLAVIDFKVADSDVYFSEVEQMLTQRYPGTLYHHNSGENKATSWFTGPIQIQVEYREESGTRLSYMDMRRYSNHIGEKAEELLKGFNQEEEQKKEDLKKL